MVFRKASRLTRIVAGYLMFSLVTQILMPSVAFALTSGPGTPEFSSFEPVGTTNMVNVSTGDFTYNIPVIQIPGADGGGYAMSLSYHSGASVEEESSWVGYGWTLNPGAINRTVRGFADDYKGTDVTYFNKTPSNYTIVSSEKVNLEINSDDQTNDTGDGKDGGDSNNNNNNNNTGDNNSSSDDAKKDKTLGDNTSQAPFPPAFNPSIGLTQALRFNNYQGFNRSYGLTADFSGAGSVGMDLSPSGITFSADINPVALIGRAIKKLKRKKETDKDKSSSANEKEEDKKWKDASSGEKWKARMSNVWKRMRNPGFNLGGSEYGFLSFAESSYNTSISRHRGFGLNYGTTFQTNPAIAHVGVEVGTSGSFHMQYNLAYENHKAYGYLYNPDKKKISKEKVLADYYVEKESQFDKRDYYLGIPFSNPDLFHVSGEGMGGGFRAYAPEIGHYYPNFVKNEYAIFNVGVDFAAGTNLGIGVNFGVGTQRTESKEWGNEGNSGGYQFSGESDVFRYTGDMGGKVEYFDNSLQTAELAVNPNFPGIKSGSVQVEGDNRLNRGSKVGRSSYIKSKKDGDKLSEFTTWNEDGTRYHYGIPVYNLQEANLSTDVDDKQDEIIDNYYVNKSLQLGGDYSALEGSTDSYKTLVGQVKSADKGAKYAYNYLLTEITTPDYVDQGPAGLDASDKGGWTKFNYTKVHSNYQWRMPYQGLIYQKGSISDTKDDLGQVSMGEKEVYFLSSIETKTHKAVFTLSDRDDGLDVSKANKLKKLDNIKLYYIGSGENTLLRTVHFEYDYSTSSDVPNSSSGKLTLKKLWTEYEGITTAKISPYKFSYTYKAENEFSQEVKDRYPDLASFFNLSSKFSLQEQNPAYNAHYLDAWGGYSAMGKEQHEKMRDWPYQGDISQEKYDPGAWQLKGIKLPSGGEILVEYEQKDYLNVQDRDVMGLASISNVINDDYKTDLPQFEVDLKDLGINEVGADGIHDVVEKMQKYYIEDENRIYFKFLYALKGEDPALDNCQSEYITGYAKVKTVSASGDDRLTITIDGEGSGYSNSGYSMTPRQGCYDFYATQRVGKLGADCEASYERDYDDKVRGVAQDYDKPEGDNGEFAGLKSFLGKLGFGTEAIVDMKTNSLNDAKIRIPKKQDVCKALNPGLSYFKVFMPKAKRGGGMRVKRLLTYDKGLENGDGVLYGNEYVYKTLDGKSTGVATTEPGSMREENPLVRFLPKKHQSWLSRHTVGKDKEQTEGPMGESILPGATITYSCVVVKNIFQEETSNGFEIHEFHTCKDYPYDKTYVYDHQNPDKSFEFGEAQQALSFTSLDGNKAIDLMVLPLSIFNYSSKKMWATQGYRFLINNMHGQPKSVRKYGGTYNDFQSSKDKVYLAGAQEYEYFEPGEQMKMLSMNNNQISVEYDIPGKEMDVAMEMKSIKDRTMDFNVEVDVSVGTVFPPPIFVGVWPSFTYGEKILSTHVTSKVIRYPVIQKSQQVYQDGLWTKTESIAFDKKTGKPLVSRTTDSYDGVDMGSNTTHDGSVYTVALPAHWHYPGMGQKVDSETNTNELSATAGSITTYGNGANPVSDLSYAINNAKVIAANAQTYSNQFAAVPGVWKEKATYAYKEGREGITSGVLAQENGYFTSYEPFNYADPASRDAKWLELNEVTRYNPNGNAIEEKNILSVYSAVKYGYNLTVPVMVAQNAKYNQIFFEDYELTGDSQESHSGFKSNELLGTEPLISSVDVSGNFVNEGGLLQLWVKSSDNTLPDLSITLTNGETVKGKYTSRSSDWMLYRFEITPTQLSTYKDGTVDISITNLNTSTLYIDDVRFQPLHSEGKCFVYDKKYLRLIAQFDDQHFGRFYQYDYEGKLIRTQIETERGVKTLQEKYYNIPNEAR